MTTRGDRKTFKNEDLVLGVTTNIDPSIWDETKYEAFIDELCGTREYQKEAIRITLRYLLGGKYANLRELAKENFESNEEIQQRYGSWTGMERHLQLPDQLSCSLDLATGTGKSYVLYGLAAILLAEGIADRVLILCPSIRKGRSAESFVILQAIQVQRSLADAGPLHPSHKYLGNYC
jgi:type III restriction enzyme